MIGGGPARASRSTKRAPWSFSFVNSFPSLSPTHPPAFAFPPLPPRPGLLQLPHSFRAPRTQPTTQLVFHQSSPLDFPPLMAAPSHTDPHPATAHKTITSRLLPNPGSSHLASSTLPFTSVSHLSRSTIRRTIVAGQPPAPGSSAQAVANAKRGGVIPQVAWNAVGVKGQAGLKAKGAGGVGTKPKGKKGGQAGWNRFKPLAKQQVPAFDAPGSVFSHAELVQGHIGGGDGVYHHPGHAFTQAEVSGCIDASNPSHRTQI